MVLPNISSGRVVDPDVVADDWDIFFTPSVPYQQRHRQHHLRSLPVAFLHLAAHHQIEQLIRARPSRCPPRLQPSRRPEASGYMNSIIEMGSLAREALAKVVSFEHLRQRGLRGQFENATHVHRLEPFGIAPYLQIVLAGQNLAKIRRDTIFAYPSTSSATVRRLRVSDRPLGSPTWAVKSPTINTAI